MTRRATAAQLNRATLHRQSLLRREPLDVVDAVRRVVAIQAQEPASPYVALWNRVADLDPTDVDRAFADRAIVKAPLMRITLHVVAADEYAVVHEAMTPSLRAARLNDRRFRATGLTAADADALVPGLLAFTATPRTKDEILEHVAGALGTEPHDGVWWALRSYSPVVHAPIGSPWSFGRRPAFEAAPANAARPAADDALRRLIVRYLEGFGPASVADFAQFSLRKISAVRAAFDLLRDELVMLEGPDGAELFDVDGAPELPDPEHAAPPRLMAMWDSILLAYADRSRVIPAEHRPHVIRRNGDLLPTVLVDGHVAGVWRPSRDGVEVTAFARLREDDWAALDAEAVALRSTLVERDPQLYGRYSRWWDALPDGERRLLGRSCQ